MLMTYLVCVGLLQCGRVREGMVKLTWEVVKLYKVLCGKNSCPADGGWQLQSFHNTLLFQTLARKKWEVRTLLF